MIKYHTDRLILREWLDQDIEPYVELNQDHEVLKYFPRLYTREESTEEIKEFNQLLKNYGYTIYACELKNTNKFIGFVGLYNRDDLPFSPCVEIGWRLAKQYWGNGYATEAAKKCLEIGFLDCNLEEIVSFTPKINKPSERVMQKIGMLHNPLDDFLHYRVSKDHPLASHVLYRLSSNHYKSLHL